MGMQEQSTDTVEESSGVSRRKLFVAGGLLATGLGSHRASFAYAFESAPQLARRR